MLKKLKVLYLLNFWILCITIFPRIFNNLQFLKIRFTTFQVKSRFRKNGGGGGET